MPPTPDSDELGSRGCACHDLRVTTEKRWCRRPVVVGAVFGLLVVIGAWAVQRLSDGPAFGAAEWETDPIGRDDLAG